MRSLLLVLGGLSPAVASPPTAQDSQDDAPQVRVALRWEPPRAGTAIHYTFSEDATLHVQHLRSTMGDSVFERDAPDRSVRQRARRVWTDTTVASGAGTSLRRDFSELGATMEVHNARDGAPRPDGKASARAALSGRSVEFASADAGAAPRFTTDPDAQGAAPPPELPLDGLRRELDLAALLPPDGRAVALGQSWELPATALNEFFAPGGEIPTYYGPIEDQEDPDIVARFGGHAVSRFPSVESGTLRAELVGLESVDGSRLADIALRFEVELHRDPAPWMQAQSLPFEMAKIGQTAHDASHRMQLRGEGRLRWDLDRHRFVEFSAEAEARSDQRLDFAFQHHGFDYAGHEHFELEGTTKILLRAREEEG